jgi:CRISPR-associated RAMP protein (TIGR02581 family)
MHKAKYNSLELEFSITPKSPLLVKSGGISINPSLPDMQFVRTFIVGKGETVYIPGASLKGVIRSYVEKILRTKKGESKEGACEITGDNSCTKKIEDIEKRENRILSSSEVYNKSCRACKIFGNGKLKSRVSFLDAYPEGNVKSETRYGVAISRLTQAVAHGPFEMEVVVDGKFITKLHLENFEIWQLGSIALALQGLNEGLVRVGFGKNRGFGEVNTRVEKIIFSFSKTLPKNEVWGIGKLVINEIKKYELINNDVLPLKVEPIKESYEALYIRREYKPESWSEISTSAISILEGVLK